MKNFVLSLSLVATVFAASFCQADAAPKNIIPKVTYDEPHTRPTYPSVIGVEALGRASSYSIFFERSLRDDLAVGVGFGTAAVKDTTTNADRNSNAVIIPMYVNYYFMKQAGSPFLTGGLNLFPNSSSLKNSTAKLSDFELPDAVIYPVLGAGYEYRTDTQFLVRVTGYLLLGSSVQPWVGMAVGYAF